MKPLTMKPLPLNTIIHIKHWPEGNVLGSIYRSNINNFTREEEIQILLLAAKSNKWTTTLSTGAIPLSNITSWKIVPIEELPLYFNWEYTWPLLSQIIKDGHFYSIP